MLVDMNTVPQCMVVSSALSSVRLPIKCSAHRPPRRYWLEFKGYLRQVIGNVMTLELLVVTIIER